MNCLMIGNSHASALHRAIRDGWTHDGISIDVVVIPGRDQPKMKLDGDKILTRGNPKNLRSNIDDFSQVGVDLKNYDAVWWVGTGLGMNISEIKDGWHPFIRASHVISDEAGTASRVSRKTMRDIVSNSLLEISSLLLLRELSERTDISLRIVPRPRPSSAILRSLSAELEAAYGDQSESALIAFLALLNELIEIKFSHIAPIVWQSLETLDGHFTAASFSISGDFNHMNANYGQVVLDQLVASCSEGL